MPDADPRSVSLGHAIGLRPQEAVDYFQLKGFRISDGWMDVWQETHAKEFTVARMARFDLLADTRHIIDRTIAEGKTTRQAAAELETKFRKEGWWGIKTITDEDDKKREVMRGSPHRIRTILRTNINTAYSAGRYRRQRETSAARPYWQYTAVLDASTRPSHRELNGRIWRADDPIWKSIYPPNGFNCRCRVRALSERQVRARGLDVLEGDAGLGGFTPDVGWNYAPGAHGLIRDPDIGARAVSGQPTWRDEGRPDARDLPAAAAPPLLDAAPSTDQARRTVDLALGLTDDVPRRMVQTPVEDVLLSRDRVAHITYKFDNHRERFANRILPTLQEPSEVWMTYYDNGEFRKRYIKVFEGAGKSGRGGLAIAEEVPGGAVLFNYIPARMGTINANRVGVPLYPKGEEN